MSEPLHCHEPVRTLVLVGPHGAGKTTLGRRLATLLGWRRDVEIGEVLRREALAGDGGAHALSSGEEFDLAVTRAELARDAASRGPRIVETWHPGNLAYAYLRSPQLAQRLDPLLSRSIAGAARFGRILVQPLKIARAAAMARRSEPGPDDIVDFFLAVGDRAVAIAERWGLDVAPSIHTDRCTVDEAAALVAIRVGTSRWNSQEGHP